MAIKLLFIVIILLDYVDFLMSKPTLFIIAFQLLHYIKTKFQTKNKTSLFFDKKGDPLALHDIVNWQSSSTGSLEQDVVGSYDSSSADGKVMSIDSAALVWADNSAKV